MASLIEDQSAADQRRMFLMEHDSKQQATGIQIAEGESDSCLCDRGWHYFSRMESAIEIAGRSDAELVMA